MTKKHLAHLAAGFITALFLATTTRVATSAEYSIDVPGMHAAIQFRISHLGFSVLTGRFNDFKGSFTWDKVSPSRSTVEVTVNTASIDTNHAERDKHLRGEDFLDVEKYPVATFKSTKYRGDASGGKLDGILTLHGVSKPVTLDVEYIGEGVDPWGGYRAGFKGHTRIKRSDFGMTYDLGPTADEMDIDLFVEGLRR